MNTEQPDGGAGPRQRFAPGSVVAGRYRIVRLVGEGGMGAVFEAVQLGVDRRVALKVLRADIADNVAAAARFHQEMRATARIEHPHTIRLYDFGQTEQGELFLAMEFLPGLTLRQALAGQPPLPAGRAVRIALQIAHGVGAGHQAGIVHRDLKPDNVMLLDHFGQPDFVKVLDFGIARSLDDRGRVNLTHKGAIIGTPAYMSPEQASGKPVDARTDLYALGIILYEMLTGTVPFASDSTVSVLVAHATLAPPVIWERAPGVDRALGQVVMRLLEKNPDDRFTDAAALATAVQGLAPSPVSSSGAPRAVAPTQVLSPPAKITAATAVLPAGGATGGTDTTGTSAAAELLRSDDESSSEEPEPEPEPPPPAPAKPPRSFLPWLGVVLPIVIPLGIVLLTMRPMLSRSAQTGVLSRLPFLADLLADTWTAKAPLHCDGNQELRIHGVTASFPGRTAVRALDNCRVTFEDCTIDAAKAIEASDNARVFIIGGRITGATAALLADGNARIDVENATVTGPVKQTGHNARITGVELRR